jgi:hypothetical protein
MFDGRSIQEIGTILSSGAGFTLEGSGKSLQDLSHLATSARTGGGQLKIKGLGGWKMQDLMHIASSGRGHVTFED